MSALKKVSQTQDPAPSAYAWKEKMLADQKEVTGRFINRECPGGEVSFHLRLYNEPVKTWTLKDGMEYKLPLGVVKHLVKNCQVEEDTSEVKLVDPISYRPLYNKRYKPRFSFVTSEYLE